MGPLKLKTVILSILAPLMFLCAVPSFGQDDEAAAPAVESLMTPEDFKASGLEKLSEKERAHLSEWLERYRQGATKGPQVSKPPSRQTKEERKAEKNYEVTANVIPRFHGWSGKTVFRLDNGQTWQQRMTGSFRYTGANSEVVIHKNIMGGYVLEHVESGRSVLVKRVD